MFTRKAILAVSMFALVATLVAGPSSRAYAVVGGQITVNGHVLNYTELFVYGGYTHYYAVQYPLDCNGNLLSFTIGVVDNGSGLQAQLQAKAQLILGALPYPLTQNGCGCANSPTKNGCA